MGLIAVRTRIHEGNGKSAANERRNIKLTFQRIQALSMKAPRMMGPGNDPNTLNDTLWSEIAITRSLSLTHLKIKGIIDCP